MPGALTRPLCAGTVAPPLGRPSRRAPAARTPSSRRTDVREQSGHARGQQRETSSPDPPRATIDRAMLHESTTRRPAHIPFSRASRSAASRLCTATAAEESSPLSPRGNVKSCLCFCDPMRRRARRRTKRQRAQAEARARAAQSEGGTGLRIGLRRERSVSAPQCKGFLRLHGAHPQFWGKAPEFRASLRPRCAPPPARAPVFHTS